MSDSTDKHIFRMLAALSEAGDVASVDEIAIGAGFVTMPAEIVDIMLADSLVVVEGGAAKSSKEVSPETMLRLTKRGNMKLNYG